MQTSHTELIGSLNPESPTLDHSIIRGSRGRMRKEAAQYDS